MGQNLSKGTAGLYPAQTHRQSLRALAHTGPTDYIRADAALRRPNFTAKAFE